MYKDNYTKIGEYYRVAQIMYDLGCRENEKSYVLQKYYSDRGVEIINRFLIQICEDERIETEKFMKGIDKIRNES